MSFLSGIGNTLLGYLQSGTQQVAGAVMRPFQGPLALAQTQVSNLVQGGAIPPDLLALQQATIDFLRNPNNTTLYAIQNLITQKGWTQVGAVRTQFPHLQEEDVQKIVTLDGRLRSLPGAVVSSSSTAALGVINITSQRTFLEGVRDIPLRYRVHPDEGLHQTAMRRLREQVNSTVHPHLKQIIVALEALISLTDSSDHDVRREHIRHLIPLLEHLNGNRAIAPQITAADWSKFDPLLGYLRSLLPPMSGVWDLNQIKEQLREVGGIVVATITAQRGMLEESCDVLTYKIKEFFGMSTGNPAEMDYSSILARGEQILSKVMRHAGDAIAKSTAQSLAVLLIVVFTHIQNQNQQNGNLQFIQSRITPCLDALKNAHQSGTWQQLVDALQQCLRVMREQETYFQGFRLPLQPGRSHISAVPDLLRLAQSHQQVLSPVDKPPEKVTPVMIEHMSRRVKERSVAFIAMKVVDALCQFPSLDPSLLTVDPSLTSDRYAPVLRERFFMHIDGSTLSTLKKWIAKRVYDLIHAASQLYVYAVVDNLAGEFSRWQREPIAMKTSQVVQWLRNWFSVASGTYSEVARTPPERMKDIFTLLGEATQSPARNGGLSPVELYDAAIKTGLDTFGPRIRWAETIAFHFETDLVPSTSNLSFVNTLFSPINFICKKFLQALVFIPQNLLNFLLKKGASFLFVHNVSLSTLIQENVGKVSTPTPSSYAIHQAIYRQLQSIFKLVRERMVEQASAQQTLNSNKVEIAGLWDALYELLHKGRYRTVDRLRQYVSGDLTLKERIEREIDGAFIPEAMDAIVMIVSTALEGALGEADMQELHYNMLGVIDRSFDPQEPVSQAQVKAIEKGISDQVDQIIEATIFYALNDKLDFTNEKQKREISLFITSLKSQTKTLKEKLERHQQALARSEARVFPAASRDTLEMVTSSLHFQNAHLEALGKADGNRYFHTETRGLLNEISKGLHEHLHPIATILNAMKQLQDLIDDRFNTWQHLSFSRQLLQSIGNGIDLPVLELADIRHYKDQCEKLSRHLSTANPLSTATLLPLDRQLNQAYSQLEQAKSTELQLHHIQHQFDVLSAMNRQQPIQRNMAERNLIALIAKLPSQELQATLKTHLLDPRAFTQSLALGLNQTLHGFTAARATLHRIRTEMELHLVGEIGIAASQSGQAREQLVAQNQSLESKIAALGTWETQVHDIPIWNIFLFDMQWLTQMISGVAKGRAKDLVNEISEALYQPHNYQGLFNQATLKFLQLYGPHHLR